MSEPGSALFGRLARCLPPVSKQWQGGGAQAGVLVALTAETEPRVILGRRALNLRLHPGEVAFPGGKREVEDASPLATALREAEEEIGLEPSLVQALGELPPLVTRSDFEVYPCVARVPAELNLVVDPAELASAFLVPLAVFAESTHYRLEQVADERGSLMVPHYQIGDDNIWGVTAAVLVQLVNLALDANLELKRNWRVKP